MLFWIEKGKTMLFWWENAGKTQKPMFVLDRNRQTEQYGWRPSSKSTPEPKTRPNATSVSPKVRKQPHSSVTCLV